MQFHIPSPLCRALEQARTLRRFIVFCFVFVSLLTLQGLSAQTPIALAADFEVNSLGEPASVIDDTCDATSCTLREAINAAENTAGLDTVTFAPDLTGNIQLKNYIPLADDLLLIGPGAGDISITAEQGVGLSVFRLSAAVTMQGLTIQGAVGGTSAIVVQSGTFTLEDGVLKDNDVNGYGGALTISQRSSAILSNSVITNNVALQGGAIYNLGDLTVINSTFHGNVTNGLFGEGGAIRNEGGTVTITSTTFIGNNSEGAGIANEVGGIATVADSTFDDNVGSAIFNVGITSTLSVTNSIFTNGDDRAVLNGGSLDVDAGGIVTVSNSIFSGHRRGAFANKWGGTFALENSTVHNNSGDVWGGGILNERSVMTIRSSTIRDNQSERGAGIANRRAGTLTINNSTISGNHAVGETYGQCGGISNDGINSLGDMILTITNSTISNNRADNDGGGICTLTERAQTIIHHSTIVFNRADNEDEDADDNMGGGIYNEGGIVSLGSTILASNYRGSRDSLDNVSHSIDSPGTITSLGFNLSDTESASFGNDDITNSTPMLDSLDDNGGPTATHALFIGSPAIDAGTNANCPATDQRGVARPLDGNEDSQAICDIGAFEVDAPNVPSTPQQETLHLPSVKH